MGDPFKCDFCKKTFVQMSSKNRHMKNFHSQVSVPVSVHGNGNIKCPLCPSKDQVSFNKFETLKNHFSDIHEIKLQETSLVFASIEQFEKWMVTDKKEVKYYIHSKVHRSSCTYTYYYCNRSFSGMYSLNGIYNNFLKLIFYRI